MNNRPCYKSLEYNTNISNVLYTHTKGFIIKTYNDPITGLPIIEKIPYNQPCSIFKKI